MNKPVVNQAGDREGLRKRQKQKERHQGHAQFVYHGSLKMGGENEVTIQKTRVWGKQFQQRHIENKAVSKLLWQYSLEGVAKGILPQGTRWVMGIMCYIYMQNTPLTPEGDGSKTRENFYRHILPTVGRWFYYPKHKEISNITGWRSSIRKKEPLALRSCSQQSQGNGFESPARGTEA